MMFETGFEDIEMGGLEVSQYYSCTGSQESLHIKHFG